MAHAIAAFGPDHALVWVATGNNGDNTVKAADGGWAGEAVSEAKEVRLSEQDERKAWRR